MTPKNLPMTEALDAWVQATTVRVPEVIRELIEETQALGEDAQMQLGTHQGQFMALLTRLAGARRVLEIGTFTGMSSLWIAGALPEDGRMLCLDASEEWTAVARKYWAKAGLSERIELRIGPALESLAALRGEPGAAGSFDMVFIDADKVSTPQYYEAALELLRRGGLVAIDNALRHGKVADPAETDAGVEAMRETARRMAGDARVAMNLTPIGDGVLLGVKL